MTTRDYPKLLERLIKLSLPVTCVVRPLGGQAASLLLRCHPGCRSTRGDSAPSPRPRLQPAPPPCSYVWLAGFYVFFHVWMNLLAEVLRFGDRLFYKAWWNAVTFEAYWRLWNLPVHHWISRHV